jgi:hypothetical protein
VIGSHRIWALRTSYRMGRAINHGHYQCSRADTKANRRWFRMSKEERERAKDEHTFSEAAPGLAADWENLVGEIMARFQTRLRGDEPHRVGMSTGG